MAGFRTFATGEVLTAANVNDFLMEQTTMTFADAVARDTALAGILRAGLNVYLEDTDRLQYYNGTAWENVPNEADVDAAGGLVDVKHVLKTNTFTVSLAANADAAVTDLAITHAMSDATNRLIISVHFGITGNQNSQPNNSIMIMDGATQILLGDADQVRNRVSTGTNMNSGDLRFATGLSFTGIYEPGDTASHDYTVRVRNLAAVTTNVFVNRAAFDSNSLATLRTASSFIIQEVVA